ncbi:MAG: hypothetical protein AAF289_17730, partial [Cyanobacteria bacterium P01_A01_bin.135]
PLLINHERCWITIVFVYLNPSHNMAIYRRIPGGPNLDVHLFEGGSENDVLIGTWQQEVLVGKAGSDMLIGGAGVDAFMIDSPLESDHIVDFEENEKILIPKDIFGVNYLDYHRFTLDTQARTLSFDGQVVATFGANSDFTGIASAQDIILFVEDASDVIHSSEI